MQGNSKAVEGKQHPDRDAQFGYIGEQAREHLAAGNPVVSVDAKKKELVGEFKNGGREWRPKGRPARVDAHDFPDRDLGKAIPYGVYDLAADSGWVNVGTDHDTAAFAVESVRRWWNGAGRDGYPRARRLLVTADAGGSNGYRTRAWKAGLAVLAAETGLEITVCHLPPGTSKWNKIEHRLFSHITMNWRGRPLTSHEVIVNSIAATTTRTGLTVRAELDPGSYPTGTEISDAQMAAIPLARHRFHGDWNYTIHPGPVPPAPAAGTAASGEPAAGVPDRAALSHPALTGMSRRRLGNLVAELAGPQEAQREQARSQRRGAERRRAAGAGPRLRLTDADRVFAVPAQPVDNVVRVVVRDPDHGADGVGQRDPGHVERHGGRIRPRDQLPVQLGAEVQGDPDRLGPDRGLARGPRVRRGPPGGRGGHLRLALFSLSRHDASPARPSLKTEPSIGEHTGR